MPKTKSTYLALIAMLLSPMVANATLIDFEDIVAGCCTFPAPGYQGFTWSGAFGASSWVISEESVHPFDGDQTFSGQNYAWSNGASDLSLTDGLFTFNSMWARTGFSGTGFTAIAHGYIGATEIFAQNFTVTGVYQFFSFDFTGIDRFEITNQTINLLIDDMTVNMVPEPGTLALLGLGLAGMGLARRRKKV